MEGDEDVKAADPGLVVGESDHERHVDQLRSVEEALQKYKREKSAIQESHHNNHADIADFSLALEAVASHTDDDARLEVALDVLADLSHDIEFGERLTSQPRVFAALQQICLSPTVLPVVAEKLLRIMAQALRNNPVAVANVVENQDAEYGDFLLSLLVKNSATAVIRKRVLGVLHALSANSKFAYSMFNDRDDSSASALHALISVFPDLDWSARERAVFILEDLDMLEHTSAGSDRRALEQSTRPEHKFLSYLQGLLLEKRGSEKQLRLAFDTLVSLHSALDIPASREFMEWLSEEVETRKSLGDAYGRTMLEARHEVFGNRNALRKADEL